VFIKLGPKHASKDEIELAVFEVIWELLLVVRVFGLVGTVGGSKLLLGFLVYSVDYGTQSSIQSTQANKDLPTELEKRNAWKYQNK
jgi:hypothetical protein